MKKTLSTLLVFSLTISTCFCLTACKKEKAGFSSFEEIIIIEDVSSKDKSASEKSDGKKTSPNKVSSNNPAGNADDQNENNLNDEELSYLDVDCISYSDFNNTHFLTINNNENLKMRFTISLPDEWDITEGKSGYKIFRNSKEIGSITSDIDKKKLNETKNVLHNTGTYGNLDVTHRIDSLGTGKKTTFLRTLGFFYNGADDYNHGVAITVDYSEIDALSVSKIISDASLSVTANDANIGAMKINDNRNSVLILGNSFVGTSEIGYTLQQMCNYDLIVAAISRGYAKVNQYANDPYIISEIQSGKYSAVFMCGFYIGEDVPCFEVIKNACDTSNTQLAIFPAHNENRTLITKAIVSYPGVKVLDWKGEIEELINSGLNVTDFCIMDDHLHSNALAGYVGAHMIYRAIFGEVPKQTNYYNVSSLDINLLGNYSSTGKVSHLANSNVYILN